MTVMDALASLRVIFYALLVVVACGIGIICLTAASWLFKAYSVVLRIAMQLRARIK